MIKNTIHLLIIFLSIATIHCEAKKVLFIGNSYTSQCSRIITDLFKNESPDWKHTFHFKGGKDLAYHLADPTTKPMILSQKWDFVVLQEQSQKSGLGGKYSQGFQDAVSSFSKIIRKNGSTPYLYLSWGRKAGDKKHPKIYPNYQTMQKKISAAYFEAGKKNRARILPVGLAYSKIKQEDQALFESLYKKDGSHPSEIGAYVVSSVFWGGLTGKDPTTIKWRGRIEKPKAVRLRQAARAALEMLSKN
ncbi:hypothetical protein N9H45_01635 [Opitutales bacterium]|nr:hypothetical protein [Opitutales bacterium]